MNNIHPTIQALVKYAYICTDRWHSKNHFFILRGAKMCKSTKSQDWFFSQLQYLFILCIWASKNVNVNEICTSCHIAFFKWKTIFGFIYSGGYNLSIRTKIKFVYHFWVWTTYLKVHQNLGNETYWYTLRPPNYVFILCTLCK
jgi:hypothetical protein